MSAWPLQRLDDVVIFLNNRRVPLKAADRTKRQGIYPYYGASGIVDHIDGYRFDGKYLLISEDGENLRSRTTPIAFRAEGRFWVNNHAHIVDEREPGILDYLEYAFSAFDLNPFITGAAQPKLNKRTLQEIRLPIPPKRERLAINGILNALTDTIELNRRMNRTLEAMARALFRNWTEGDEGSGTRRRVADLVSEGVLHIGDGYRAKNSELGKPGLPFIRAGELKNGFATAEADVLMQSSVDRAGDKISLEGDVAFTSKGTIGRFARVSRHTPPFVYSPQICFWRSADRNRLRPSILYLWMIGPDLGAQIAAVADQSDMAPYVSLRDQRSMEMPVFGPTQHQLADELDRLVGLTDLNIEQSRTLAALRDALLPKLTSGELRVRDGERALAEAV